MKILLLKRLLAGQEAQARILCELLALSKGQAFDEVTNKYLKALRLEYQKLNDWLFQEFGEMDLSDILPSDED